MEIINIRAGECKNYTPIVRKTLESLDKTGGVLNFERGEYHFYREGAYVKFIAVSNNSACEKHIVFPIFGKKNVKINGNGSTFVFHEVTFPFAVVDSEEIELSDFKLDTKTSPYANFTVGKVTDEGFYLHINKKSTPYRTENGALVFERELGEVSSIDGKFFLHAISRRNVQYLFVGNCKESHENLPAPFVCTDATEKDGAIFFKYRDGCKGTLKYSEGEIVKTLLDGGRNTDVILLSESREVSVKDVTVRRGIGMGIIAQLSENIEIDGFRTDEGYHGEGATLSADSMHFVNCYGKLEIKNCEITHTLDDAINVHGMYTRVNEVQGDVISVTIGHCEQYFFNPYRVGAVIKSLSDRSFDYTAKMRVLDAKLNENGKGITLKVELLSGKPTVGELVELPLKMPNVHIHHNRFYHYPHLRISGAGDILIENNYFGHSLGALLAKDLAKYWYESGRVRNLVFRNNTLKECNALGGVSFITVDVDGVPHNKTPKIHGRVEIYGNRIEGVKDTAVMLAGVSEPVIENNNFATEKDNVIYVDGVKI